MNRNLIRVVSLALTALAVTLFATPARATSSPGATLKAAYAGDAGCLNTSSYGQLVNNCSYAVLVVGTIAVSENAWHDTIVSIAGSYMNSWCQTVTINAVGNGAHVGSVWYTTTSYVSWQNLYTLSRYVWPGTGILFRCSLEPNGYIGLITAN